MESITINEVKTVVSEKKVKLPFYYKTCDLSGTLYRVYRSKSGIRETSAFLTPNGVMYADLRYTNILPFAVPITEGEFFDLCAKIAGQISNIGEQTEIENN
jgi:hypothetical protein